MKYHFYNANILSAGEIIKGDVVVEDNVITYVGSSIDTISDRKIDVNGNLLMAGFVNAHTHSPMSIFRGIADDIDLNSWLFDKIFPAEQKLTPEDVYWGEMLGIAEQVRAGITTIEECYFFYDKLLEAINKSGIRCRIGIPNNFQECEDGKMKEFLDSIISQLDNELIKPVIYAHSIYTLSDDELNYLVDYSAKNKLPMSMHMSETLKEVGDCTVKNECTPPEYLENIGFLDRKTTLYHCVHLDKDDIKILADYNVNVVTCPSSNLKLASGIAPIYSMLNQGLNICIGTDGVASNNAFDMFKEMFLVATLNKALLYDASIISAKQVIEMATKNGATALGFDRCGDIKVGNLADLILLDLNAVHHQPLNNIISNIVYSAKSSDVYFTMVNGKILYENGKFYIGENIEDIYSNRKKIAKRIFNLID